MVDAEARMKAKQLLEAFGTGRIGYDAVDNDWPLSEDRAVTGIGAVLFDIFFSDFGPYKLREPGDRLLLKRCEAFLSSGLDYEWPDGLTSTGGAKGAIAALTLGLWRPGTLTAEEAGLRGEVAAWPFLSGRQLDELARS